jgi:SAM-dependent methyltransferase
MEVLLSPLTRAFPAVRTWLLSKPFFTSTLLPMLPRRLRWGLRRLYFAPLDLLDRVRGTRDDMVPPHGARFTGSAGDDFLRSGKDFVAILSHVADLGPHSRVLDIGSGIGRLAVPLTDVLTPPGSYDGIDVVESGIRWCNEKIASRFPNFHFTLADVKNVEYHPDGATDAADYSLPYPDDHFDIVAMYSVFTHMLSPDMVRYVHEIARVLKPGGKCFTTYILINDETGAAMREGRAIYNYKHHVDNHWLIDDSTKCAELNVAYDESHVRQVFEDAGLTMDDGIFYGDWSGLPARSDPGQPVIHGLGQDVVLATKPLT